MHRTYVEWEHGVMQYFWPPLYACNPIKLMPVGTGSYIYAVTIHDIFHYRRRLRVNLILSLSTKAQKDSGEFILVAIQE